MARERAFLPRFTNSRCAGYRLFLDTYPDSVTKFGAAKAGFPLVKSWKKQLVSFSASIRNERKKCKRSLPVSAHWLPQRIGQTWNAPCQFYGYCLTQHPKYLQTLRSLEKFLKFLVNHHSFCANIH